MAKHYPERRSNSQPPMALDIDERSYREALETLPPLTRVVLLLSSLDKLSYEQIGWRCGISIEDVTVRVSDALVGIDRYLSDRAKPVGSLRRSLLRLRRVWAAARMREQDRRLASGLPPDKRPEKRKFVEWVVWLFETIAR